MTWDSKTLVRFSKLLKHPVNTKINKNKRDCFLQVLMLGLLEHLKPD